MTGPMRKANQKEPAVRGERDQENRYDSDGDDETRGSPEVESRAAAGFRFHEFILAAEKLGVACAAPEGTSAAAPPTRVQHAPRFPQTPAWRNIATWHS